MNVLLSTLFKASFIIANNAVKIFMHILLLYNYPIMLCIERGNYELFVATLLLLSTNQLTRDKGSIANNLFYGKAFLFLGSIIKDHPIFSLFILNLTTF